MLSNSYIKVSYTFTIIVFIAESTLKFINHTRCKFFWKRSLKREALAYLFCLLNTICNLQQLVISLRDFLNLIIIQGKEELKTMNRSMVNV